MPITVLLDEDGRVNECRLAFLSSEIILLSRRCRMSRQIHGTINMLPKPKVSLLIEFYVYGEIKRSFSVIIAG